MSYPELRRQLRQILSNLKTLDELKVVSELYRERWYEIDRALARRFKKGDFIKWHKGTRVYWGIVTEEVKPRGRYVKAVSTEGREWKLGGSVIEKVTDLKRIEKMLTQLKAQGVKIEVSVAPAKI